MRLFEAALLLVAARRGVPRGLEDRRAGTVAGVLAARQIAQALITARWPTRQVLRVGGVVDAAHGLSMVALAVADARRRVPAALSALSAAGLAVRSGQLARSPGRLTGDRRR